jgi:hypothetical protein
MHIFLLFNEFVFDLFIWACVLAIVGWIWEDWLWAGILRLLDFCLAVQRNHFTEPDQESPLDAKNPQPKE